MATSKRKPTTSTPEAVVIARYKSEVLPLLRAAGFEGSLANMTRQAGRGQLLAFVSRSGGSVTLGLTGNDGRASFSLGHTFVLERHSLAEASEKIDAYVATLKKSALPRIAKMAREVLPEPPKDLAEAARALLAWLARDRDFKGIVVTSVSKKGRTLTIRLRGRRAPIEVDRSTLMTLLPELRAAAKKPKDVGRRDLRYALHGQELDAYLAKIAEDDRDEARMLWVHLCSPYDVPAGDHPLAGLFPKPLAIAKKLNVAASGAALVVRALPYAKRRSGSVVDRVAAIRILTMMLDDVPGHRQAEAILEDVAGLAASLAEEKLPLLRECGRVLEDELAACRAP